MPYTISGETVGLAIGPVSEAATDVHEVLGKQEMGLANVSIKDDAGRKIVGDELVDCIDRKSKLPKTYGQFRKHLNRPPEGMR
jgi:hypothetical protein